MAINGHKNGGIFKINGHKNGGSNASPLMAINGYASLERFHSLKKTRYL